MANSGVGSRFVSVNLNKSYGEPSKSTPGNTFASNRSWSSNSGHGTGGGMVVLSRPRNAQKPGPKLSVPPPLNLPSLRKELERFDLSVGGGGQGTVGSFTGGSRSSSSVPGWAKPASTASLDKSNHHENSRRELGIASNTDVAGKASASPMLQSDRAAHMGNHVHGIQGTSLSRTTQPLNKSMILRGEDFPSLRASLPPTSANTQKHDTTKLKNAGNEEMLQAHLLVSSDPKPFHVTAARGPNQNQDGTNCESSNFDPDSKDKISKSDYLPGPFSSVRMNPRFDWADDERDTSHGLSDRGRDTRFSKGEDYWNQESEIPRSAVLPTCNQSTKWSDHREDGGAESPKTRHYGKHPRTSNWQARESSKPWMNTHHYAQDLPAGRDRSGPRFSFTNRGGSRYHEGRREEAFHRRDTGDEKKDLQFKNSHRPSPASVQFDEFGRERQKTPSANAYLTGDVMDIKTSLSPGHIVTLKKKKDATARHADFHDPVRESFEAELERVQKMQEEERCRVIEEQERAIEQARREEEERLRMIREEEERERKLEEEAREAAWKAEQERLESVRRSEEQRLAREDEKRRIIVEEERRKEAAKQKLLELEAKIAARRQAEEEATKIGVPDLRDDSEADEKIVERFTTTVMTSSSSSSSLSAVADIRGKPVVGSWKRNPFDDNNAAVHGELDCESPHAFGVPSYSPVQPRVLHETEDDRTGPVSEEAIVGGIAPACDSQSSLSVSSVPEPDSPGESSQDDVDLPRVVSMLTDIELNDREPENHEEEDIDDDGGRTVPCREFERTVDPGPILGFNEGTEVEVRPSEPEKHDPEGCCSTGRTGFPFGLQFGLFPSPAIQIGSIQLPLLPPSSHFQFGRVAVPSPPIRVPPPVSRPVLPNARPPPKPVSRRAEPPVHKSNRPFPGRAVPRSRRPVPRSQPFMRWWDGPRRPKPPPQRRMMVHGEGFYHGRRRTEFRVVRSNPAKPPVPPPKLTVSRPPVPPPKVRNLKRNLHYEDDVEASLHRGVVCVFEQRGIEIPTDEGDFIEVRSKRQMLNDRRVQRERDNLAKSRTQKVPQKSRFKGTVTRVGSSSVKNEGYTPRPDPATATPVQDSEVCCGSEGEKDNVQIWSQQVMPLTQSQLDEAMKFDEHVGADVAAMSSPDFDTSFSPSDPVSTLLAGEKIQFGAVASPAVETVNDVGGVASRTGGTVLGAVSVDGNVTLPADLSIEQMPLSPWPHLLAPPSSFAVGAPVPAPPPLPPPPHHPFYEPVLGPVFANVQDSGLLGPWQQHHRPPPESYGQFLSAPVRFSGPPQMVLYNHFAPAGQFGQVGMSFLGTAAAYIPSGKSNEWKPGEGKIVTERNTALDDSPFIPVPSVFTGPRPFQEPMVQWSGGGAPAAEMNQNRFVEQQAADPARSESGPSPTRPVLNSGRTPVNPPGAADQAGGAPVHSRTVKQGNVSHRGMRNYEWARRRTAYSGRNPPPPSTKLKQIYVAKGVIV